jgi:hypothetical protein
MSIHSVLVVYAPCCYVPSVRCVEGAPTSRTTTLCTRGLRQPILNSARGKTTFVILAGWYRVAARYSATFASF